MNSRPIRYTATLGFALSLVAGSVQGAYAASPLAAIPVGQSANYHITMNSDSPKSGQSSSDLYVLIKRATPLSFVISVNGAPAGTITASPDGSVDIPRQLKKPMAPFGEMGLLMKGAPQPLAAGSNWIAAIPIPLEDDTDNVAVTVAVGDFGPGGATITGNGQSSTTVKPMLRSKPTDITINESMAYNSAKLLTHANSSITIVVKMGKIRKKTFNSTWTVTLTPQ